MTKEQVSAALNELHNRNMPKTAEAFASFVRMAHAPESDIAKAAVSVTEQLERQRERDAVLSSRSSADDKSKRLAELGFDPTAHGLPTAQ